MIPKGLNAMMKGIGVDGDTADAISGVAEQLSGLVGKDASPKDRETIN